MPTTKVKVFVDSDVVISSLLSEKGAAFFLLNQNLAKLQFYISNFSAKEQKAVIKRLKISPEKHRRLTKNLKIVRLKEPLSKIKSKYRSYVTDVNDAHIVAGAKTASAKFLITYNQKHFNEEKLKRDLDVILLTPAKFLQYLRGRKLLTQTPKSVLPYPVRHYTEKEIKEFLEEDQKFRK